MGRKEVVGWSSDTITMAKSIVSLISEEKGGCDPASIATLTLPRRDLHQVTGLDICKSLTRLDLSYNCITSLEGIATCKSLKWLSVSGNNLKSLNGIQALVKLTVFNGSRNAISSMEELAGLVELRALILNDNEIRSICPLDQLTNLNTLVLSRNPIDNLGKKLKRASSLEKLSLSDCLLRNMGGFLKGCKLLKELRLARNQLTSLPMELKKNQQLSILDIGNNNVESLSDLEVLQSLPNLVNLNLRGNPVTKENQLEEVQRMLPNLHVLDGRPLSKQNKGNLKPEDDQSGLSRVKEEESIRTSVKGKKELDSVQEEKEQSYDRKKGREKKEKKALNEPLNGSKPDAIERETKGTKKREHSKHGAVSEHLDESKSFFELVFSEENVGEHVSKKNRAEIDEKEKHGDANFIANTKKQDKKSKSRHKEHGFSVLEFDIGTSVGEGGPSTWD